MIAWFGDEDLRDDGLMFVFLYYDCLATFLCWYKNDYFPARSCLFKSHINFNRD